MQQQITIFPYLFYILLLVVLPVSVVIILAKYTRIRTRLGIFTDEEIKKEKESKD